MKIISFALQKGGVGKTTDAFNVASWLDRTFSVLAIDLDRNQQLIKLNSINKTLNCISADDRYSLKNILKNSKADYVIMDLGGFDSELQRWAMAWSDLIIIPTSKSGNDIAELVPFINKIQTNILSSNDYTKCMILASRIQYNNYSFQKELSKEFSKLDRFIVANTKISRLSEYELMMDTGKSIFEFNNQRAIVENIKFVDEIKDYLDGK